MKDVLILIGMILGAALIGWVLFLYGTTGVTHNVQGVALGGAAVEASVIAQGTRAPIDTRVNYLITNKSQLQKLWSTIYGIGSTTPTTPKIDFSKNQVMAVFAGTEPTGGYTISVSKVEDISNKRMVTIVITSPATSCTVAQVRTAPYEILTVPSTTLPLSHSDTTETHTC